MTNPSDQKILQLEQQLQMALRQLAELAQRVNYLERENSRRKSEVFQISSVINRRG